MDSETETDSRMTPPPEKPPLSLEELLAAWHEDQWVFIRAIPTADEMAARLRAVAALHMQHVSGYAPLTCLVCRALDGER